jgi:hypothetical protein
MHRHSSEWGFSTVHQCLLSLSRHLQWLSNILHWIMIENNQVWIDLVIENIEIQKDDFGIFLSNICVHNESFFECCSHVIWIYVTSIHLLSFRLGLFGSLKSSSRKRHAWFATAIEGLLLLFDLSFQECVFLSTMWNEFSYCYLSFIFLIGIGLDCMQNSKDREARNRSFVRGTFLSFL